MSLIAKLIGMAALGQTAAESKIAIHNFLSGLVIVLALALTAGLMAGALLVGTHLIIYNLLVTYVALTSLEAMGVTFAIGFIITGIVVFAAVQQSKHLFELPKVMPVQEYQQPLGTRVAGVVEAFIDGLTGRSTPRF